MKRKLGVRSYKQMKAIYPEELATLRAHLGTQPVFAQLAGASVQRISQAETGKPISTSAAAAIARGLKRPVESLFVFVYKKADDKGSGAHSEVTAPSYSHPTAALTTPAPTIAPEASACDIPEAFIKVFGSDPEIFLVYSELTLNPKVPEIIDAYSRLLRHASKGVVPIGDPLLRSTLRERPLVTYDPRGNHGKDGYHFRAMHSACVCEVRAAAYLSAAFSCFRSLKYHVVGNVHADVHRKADLSFVSFGTLINSKTQELLANSQAFIGFQEGRFVSKRLAATGQPQLRPKFLHPEVDESSDYDYGVIIRMHPSDATVEEQRVWTACAGVQQVGTSGAAWVLAKSWRRIAEELKRNTGRFVCLVQVPKGEDKSDEHAVLKWTVERPEDLEEHESDS